jgi:hypothetical protein
MGPHQANQAAVQCTPRILRPSRSCTSRCLSSSSASAVPGRGASGKASLMHAGAKLRLLAVWLHTCTVTGGLLGGALPKNTDLPTESQLQKEEGGTSLSTRICAPSPAVGPGQLLSPQELAAREREDADPICAQRPAACAAHSCQWRPCPGHCGPGRPGHWAEPLPALQQPSAQARGPHPTPGHAAGDPGTSWSCVRGRGGADGRA